jgi:hypothetical protein
MNDHDEDQAETDAIVAGVTEDFREKLSDIMATAGRDETAWLIENGRQEWWTGRTVGDEAQFTSDPNDVIRFARYEDAETARCWLLWPICHLLRSTEHIWCDGTLNAQR